MTDIAGIKACKGYYSIGDTARHYGVSKSHVWRLWNGASHSDIEAAQEAPYIEATRVPREVIKEDWPVLRLRGMTIQEAAKYLGVSKSTMYNALKEVAA